MEPWSDTEVNPAFELKIFLDTNVWVYLIDKSYPSLNNLFDVFNEHPFVRLVSSGYVVFEFIGVRKREHYLRQVAENAKVAAGGAINFSSLVNSLDRFNANEAAFEDVVGGIKTSVYKEIEEITRDYGVDFEYSVAHSKQIPPAIEICLSTKINNQDSLVMVSAIHPKEPISNDNIQVLSNDTAFVNEARTQPTGNVLEQLGYRIPLIQSITSFRLLGTGNGINLTEKNKEYSRQELKEIVDNAIPRLIQSHNADVFLGRTFAPIGLGLPPNLLCFKLVPNVSLRTNTYVTILSKNLDFIYTSRHIVSEFRRKNEPLPHGFVLPQEDFEMNSHVSFLLFDEAGEPLNDAIIDVMRQEGNLVFLHPDSFN